MNIVVRLGTEKDINAIEDLYNRVNDYLENTTNYPGWQKDIYPIRQDAVKGIDDGCLYVAMQDDKIVGSIILRSEQEEVYLTAPWKEDLKESEVLVIHTFAVDPECLKQGIGNRMLDFAYKYALNSKIKALRLDVYEKNVPAIKLYKKCGYQYIDTVSLGLEQYGLNWFELYERLV